MKVKEFYDKTDLKALYDLPEGIVALREEDIFKLMKEYAREAFEAGRKHVGSALPNTFMYDRFEDYLKEKENDTGN